MSTITQSIERLRPVDADGVDDLELLERYRTAGDAEAFGRIAHRHAGAVYATCLRVLGDSAPAEDAAQETFFRLLRRPSDVTRSVSAWLHRTATNVSLDMYRSDTSRHRRELAYGRDHANARQADGLDAASHQASTWAELSPSIDQALSEMPEELRSILVEHYLMGRTQAELAEASGLCPATICRRVKQGIEELRRRLRLKGIDAMPAVLAGLLCHVAARQAPAGVLLGVAKMSMMGPMDSTLPARISRTTARSAMKTLVKSPIPQASAVSQIGAGIGWIAVSLAVLALFVAMGIGLVHGMAEFRTGASSATLMRPDRN